MANSTLYLVTTDFDLDMTSKAFDDDNKRIWSPEQVIQYQKEKRGEVHSKDFFISDFADLERIAFERHFRKLGLSLFPCLDLRPNGIHLRYGSGIAEYFFGPDEEINSLVLPIVQLVNPVDGKPITNRKLEGRTHLDMVINYFSNEGKYNQAIAQLKEHFSVTEVNVCRERDNILEEGFTDEELYDE